MGRSNRTETRVSPGPLAEDFIDAVFDRHPVTGLTHGFYRYPARFSPTFANTAIRLFTSPGDLVLDPFMGGGTTLVEARVTGRQAIGVDISSLACFIARVKTTVLSKRDRDQILDWYAMLSCDLNVHRPSERPYDWMEKGYQRNISGWETWRIRKTMEQALSCMSELPSRRARDFARCAVLRTGQWALDCRREIPTVDQFRAKLMGNTEKMLEAATQFARLVAANKQYCETENGPRVATLNRSVVGLEDDELVQSLPSPRLVLTSPPYPGAHVLYHRWQIRGRKETPAPFWIANSLDGTGAPYYTMGDRKEEGLATYFDQLGDAFSSLAKVCNKRSLIVQMVAFPEPDWQLAKYLGAMQDAGFEEVRLFEKRTGARDGRLWREVPNRKWYAVQGGSDSTSREVVLFHVLNR